jgi:putative RNA 2'-phosphotransferase
MTEVRKNPLSRKSQIRVTDLSRFLIYILAHRPDEFGLVPDSIGFISTKELLRAIHEEPGWGYVREGHIREVLIGKDRALFLQEKDRIRAAEVRWHLDLQTPSENTPKILFIAVRRRAHVSVMEKGLFSERHLVLSPDRDMALRIGRRRDQKPILLEVMTGPAQHQGVFFHAFGDLYLAREIPPEFISGPPVPEEIREPQPPKKEKSLPQAPMMSGGTFVLDVHRDPDLSRRRSGRKPRGWKEDSRKMRRSKG